jgi:hypothetical protein
MSISNRVYIGYKWLKDITSRKLFRFTLLFSLSTFLFFGVLNTYAAFEVGYVENQQLLNVASGADKNEINALSTSGTSDLVKSAQWVIWLLGKDGLEDLEITGLDELDLPYDMERGLLGMIDDGTTTVYANYPLVNIGTHMAEQWVPGYKESVTSTYAQTDGYTELVNNGIVELWNKSLNIAYLAFVVVMLVAGFMIMFRHKLGGQAVVTLGNVLPNVVMALILATFSFAIVGLIIDLGGVLIAVIANFYGVENVGSIADPLKMIGTLLSPGQVAVGGVSGAAGLTGIIAAAIGTSALTAGAAIPAWIAVAGVAGILGILIFLILLGIVAVGAIMVFITLIKAYVSLIFNVILGPVQIALGAIPGNAVMIQNWFTSVLRNVFRSIEIVICVSLSTSGSQICLD